MITCITFSSQEPQAKRNFRQVKFTGWISATVILWESTKPVQHTRIPAASLWTNTGTYVHFQLLFIILRLWTSWSFWFLTQHHWTILTIKEGLKAELKWLPSRSDFLFLPKKQGISDRNRQTVLSWPWHGAWFCWMATFQSLSPQELIQLCPAAAWPVLLLGWSPDPHSNSCF